ncbi:PDSS2 [Bugula neritina]|uniref:PDSS2 n=1 Tax=Bugula neritina TaxID=10212 RepID=A0A7J7K0W6_BUGNE|nr:PDSS2 [Bugula neritina]
MNHWRSSSRIQLTPYVRAVVGKLDVLHDDHIFHSTTLGRLRYSRSNVLTQQYSSSAKDGSVCWNTAVSVAEKVVGYPTSFMNLRFWLSDEMSNVAVNMRKLIGTKHPLMKTAKGLLFDNKENMQTRGLVVLLIAKAAAMPENARKFEHHSLDKEYVSLQNTEVSNLHSNGILSTQRSLAEITEMINTAFVLHRGVMDIDLSDKQRPFDSETEDLLYGNKMSLLSGDYLLAKASAGLAALGNTYVVEIMASAISDLMESRFFLDDLLSDEVVKLSLSQWEELAYKTGACLYAKSCQSALMLREHPENVTNAAFEFGKYFGLLRQIKSELDAEKGSERNQSSILSILSTDELKDVQNNYVENAIDNMTVLTNVEAREALKDIVLALSSSISYEVL